MISKCLGILLCLSTLQSTLYGYIDPGSGSYILQIIIAGGAAAAYTIKVYWKNIRTIFHKVFKKNR